MTDNQYPVAMFRPEHTTYGIAYWPAPIASPPISAASRE